MTAGVDRTAAAAELWDRVAAFVDRLEEADWRRPTPCAGWSVHDLVGHLSGLQVAFDTGREEPPPAGWSPDPALHPRDARTEAGVAARRGWSAEALREELAAAREGHVARLDAVGDWSAPAEGPVGPTTEDGLFQMRIFDLWVHLQDLRLALDLDVEADDVSAAAAIAHRYVFELVPWLWGKRTGAPDGAAMRFAFGPPLDVDTVVAVRAGRARPQPDADPGRCAVEGSPAALTLLVSGRLEAEDLRARGLLRWSGDRGEEFVARARLF